MKRSEFRAELVKIMPGYSWTVHKGKDSDTVFIATGIQSSGSNRLSTLRVERREDDRGTSYQAKSAGYGTRAPWLHTESDVTLARVLRCLQEHYERIARQYNAHAIDLQTGRKTVSTPAA